MSLLLIGLLLGAGALTLRQKTAREGSKGLALALASELRAARALAQAEQTFVAVCFPSDGASNPVADSFALRQGHETGRLARVRHFDGEFRAAVFTGVWPAQPGMLPLNPASTSLTSVSGLNCAAWLGSGSGDYAVVFGPDGSACGKGLFTLNGEMALLTVTAIRYSSFRDRSFQASQAADPMTVLISPSGTVRVEEGALAAQGLGLGGDALSPATPLPLEAIANSAPQIFSVEAMPSRNPEITNASLAQTYIEIHPEAAATGSATEYGLASFLIKATDPEGGPLFFEATSEASQGAQGSFSTPSKGRMEWIEGMWQASVSWRPPPEAERGTTFRFKVVVSDEQGLSATASTSAGLIPALDTLEPARLAVQSYSDEVRVANIDGSDLVLLTGTGEKDAYPRFTHDGTKLITFSGPNLRRVMIQNADGTDRRLVTELPPDSDFVEFDRSSTLLSYKHGGAGPPTDLVDPNGVVQSYNVDTDHLSVVHLATGTVFDLSRTAEGPATWDPLYPKTLSYDEVVVDPDPNSTTGWTIEERTVEFTGFPPSPSDTSRSTSYDYDEEYVFNPHLHRCAAYYSPPDPNSDPPKPATIEMAGPQSGTLVSGLTFRSNRSYLAPDDPETQMSWSGDGRHLIYLDGDKVMTVPVFSDTYTLLGAAPVEIASTSEKKLWPRLSPDGSQAFYLMRDPGAGRYHLYRSPVGQNAAPTKLTHNIDGAHSYDITR